MFVIILEGNDAIKEETEDEVKEEAEDNDTHIRIEHTEGTRFLFEVDFLLHFKSIVFVAE